VLINGEGSAREGYCLLLREKISKIVKNIIIKLK